MDTKKLLNELELLKSDLSLINKKIDYIESLINDKDNYKAPVENFDLKKDMNLLDKFKDYLINVKNLKEGSIKDYCGELKMLNVKIKLTKKDKVIITN